MMGEAWEDLAAFRRLRTEAAHGIKEIKDACVNDHAEQNCRECYEKSIELLKRSRYLDSKIAEKWFGDCAAKALEELDELLTLAAAYKAKPAEIDRRAEEERKRAYIQKVKASPSIRKSLEELMDGKEVFASIGFKNATFDETVAELREALRSSGELNEEAGTEDTEKALQRLMESKNPEERLDAYRETFFLAKPGEVVSDRTQMYLDRLQEGATMDDIVNKIAVDRRSSIGAMDRKEQHKKRIEDLRRARAAHELQKSRKDSDRKDSTQRPQPPDEVYDQPPCHVCEKYVDLQDFVACPVCQVLVDAEARSKATVYCSIACFSSPNGHEAHVETAHFCAGGDHCSQLTDEDVDMSVDDEGPFLCKECLQTHKFESVFCSVRCADVNFQRHREHVHLPERRRRGKDDHDRDQLIWENEFRQRYHARDIQAHLLPLETLLADFQQKNNIEAMVNVYPD